MIKTGFHKTRLTQANWNTFQVNEACKHHTKVALICDHLSWVIKWICPKCWGNLPAYLVQACFEVFSCDLSSIFQEILWFTDIWLWTSIPQTPNTVLICKVAPTVYCSKTLFSFHDLMTRAFFVPFHTF